MILADGSIVRVGGAQAESAGLDLTSLFVGTEGTFGIVTKVAVRLLRVPEKIHTMLAAFTSLDAASQTVSDIIAAGIVPAALEMMDRVTIDACEPVFHPGYPADAEAVLIVELDGLTEAVAEQSTLVESICNTNGASELREADDPEQRADLWATRIDKPRASTPARSCRRQPGFPVQTTSGSDRAMASILASRMRADISRWESDQVPAAPQQPAAFS